MVHSAVFAKRHMCMMDYRIKIRLHALLSHAFTAHFDASWYGAWLPGVGNLEGAGDLQQHDSGLVALPPDMHVR